MNKTKSVVLTRFKLQDKFGEIIKGEKLSSSHSKYNENEQQIEEKEFNPNDELDGWSNFTYDNNDKMIESKRNWRSLFDSEIKNEIVTFKYNENGSVIEENTYSEDGNLEKKII